MVAFLLLQLALEIFYLQLEFAVEVLHDLDLVRILRLGVVLEPIALLLGGLQVLLELLDLLLEVGTGELQLELELLVALGELGDLLVAVVQLGLEGLLEGAVLVLEVLLDSF